MIPDPEEELENGAAEAEEFSDWMNEQAEIDLIEAENE
jgi:hypothetical protein